MVDTLAPLKKCHQNFLKQNKNHRYKKRFFISNFEIILKDPVKGLDIRNKTITNEIFDEDDVVVNALLRYIWR